MRALIIDDSMAMRRMLAAYVAGDVDSVCALAAAHQVRIAASLSPHTDSDAHPSEP